MLDDVEPTQNLPPGELKDTVRALQWRLFGLQRSYREAGLAAIVVFEGWEGAGKGSFIRTLTQRLEPRCLRLHAMGGPRTFEQRLPGLYRFWMKIPRRGHWAIFDRSWYHHIQTEFLEDSHASHVQERRIQDVLTFERTLADQNQVLIKLFLHISRKVQRERFKKLASDPGTEWRIDGSAWERHRDYERRHQVIKKILSKTHSDHAPWIVVDSTDLKTARAKVLESVVASLEAGLEARALPLPHAEEGPDPRMESLKLSDAPLATEPKDTVPSLHRLDLELHLDPKEYGEALIHQQLRLRELAYQCYLQKRSVVLVFEGWDAAGKGGCIRRLTEKIDPRGYEVYTIGAPEGDDRDHHYLWRFWRRLRPPEEKQLLVFDRSWYGRVLVERVEGLATVEEWQRAYQEINDFESQLVDAGILVLKFWIHISKEEQLRRFERRNEIPYKRWKLTDEDWRNRERWSDYEEAVEEMVRRTHGAASPWVLVEGEHKLYGRVKVLRRIADAMEKMLKGEADASPERTKKKKKKQKGEKKS